MPADRYRITASPLDIDALARLVAGPAHGAVVTFAGTVRDHNAGRRVLFLEYEAFESLAVKTLERIGREAEARWPGCRVAIAHRIGRLEIGEASVAVVAASGHRAEAFEACRFAIERVKQVVPVWKKEHFDGGAVWIEGAAADPSDESAVLVAETRARGRR